MREAWLLRPEVFDALFQANDINNAILEHLAAPSVPPVDVTPVLLRMEGMINPQKGAPSTPASPAHGDRSFHTPSPKDASYGSVRVPTRKVDRFLNIAVELVITRNRMQSLVEKFHELESEDFRDAVEILSHLVDETQQLVMDIRMLPISLLFNPFSRSVRDLARERNKSVDLMIQGGDTRVDKRAIEELSDPLLHLLRNAIDHGMESTDDRRAAHKNETGKITLRAFQGIDKTIIEVIDDGPGIDRERIKKKALKRS
jgi:two-component system chemotaxis sensor kinase CheA